jgi:polyhydroxyalkanoate synthesis repressor PhaR
MTTIKKYSNRRLYDTGESRYITQDELAAKIRTGDDVRVVDAKTDEDLTQATLTQIILESASASRLLPVPLLLQLIRMGDDNLSEFFGRYVSWTLELYLKMKQGAQTVAPYNPFVMAPFNAANALAQMFGGSGPPPAPPPPPAQPAPSPDVADLRRELEELKRSMKKRARR